MKQVTKEEFYAAVDKAAAIDPMPTREYLPIRENNVVIGQQSKWECQKAGRQLFGMTEIIFVGHPDAGNRYFLVNA